MKKIVVIEDNTEIRELLVKYLGKKYNVTAFSDGGDSLSFITSGKYDLAIIDLGLPGISGNHLISAIHTQFPAKPIISISGQCCLDSNYSPYHLGATFFLQKPFDLKEMVRIVSGLLGLVKEVRKEMLSLGKLIVDHNKHDAFCNTFPLGLSPQEFRILYYLGVNEGETVSRERILDRCWKNSLEQSDRVVDYQISRIRKKLKNSGVVIDSKYSEGYLLRCVSLDYKS